MPPTGDINPIESFNRLLHEPARFLIMAALYVVESGDFTFLMGETSLTWGNLSSHVGKLEEAGYLELEKTFKGRKPYTMIRLTGEGREAFRQYRRWMMEMLESLSD